MSKEKDQISKGLRALLTNIDKSGNSPINKEKTVKELSNAIAEIPIKKIETNPFQPRKDFDQAELLELTKSIKVHGVIQPITVRALGDKFQIISGERRWRASKLAGLKEIPAYVRLADDQGMLEMAIVENIQRAELNPMEISISYQRLIDECDLSHEDMAERVGKNRSTITNYLRLLKLSPKVQLGLKEDKLSMGHAKAILSLEDPVWQIELYDQIIKKGLSVRATEQLAKTWKKGKTVKSKQHSDHQSEHPEINRIRNRLIQKFGTKVDIKRNSKGKGQFTFHFNSDDQFNDILDLFED